MVLASCRPCIKVGACQAGTYLNWRCMGHEIVDNECLRCSERVCTADEYAGGCVNLSNTRCLPYTNCGPGFFLEDESRTRDGVCRQCETCGDDLSTLVPCNRYNNVVCKGTSCGRFLPCPRRTNQNRSAFFCYYGAGADLEFCGVCPRGYDTDGHNCLECPKGFTCNGVGEVECRGQCGPGINSKCESIWQFGYAVCDRTCELPPPSTRVPWRGSYVRASEADCATYFLCTAGSYKDFSPGGTVDCKPCVGNGSGVYTRWVTDGLSVADSGSCLWECNRGLATQTIEDGVITCVARAWTILSATNQAGKWAGVDGVESACGLGMTSEALSAMRQDECVVCPPLVPDVQAWQPGTEECAWYCTGQLDDHRGGACVPRRFDCNRAGLVRAPSDVFCVSTGFPWNRPGYRKTGWGEVMRNGSGVVVHDDVMNVTFSSRIWGLTGRHTVTVGGATRTVEGPLCSATTARIEGVEYVLGAVCNRSFLVWLDVERAGTGLHVLIGNATRGWRDGFRTQALFESELYVAWGGSSLFVLDRWNCLLREVVIWERPGDYRTRVYSVWGLTDDLIRLVPPQPRCYGQGALAWPRRWWRLVDGWLLFSDEDGLWQMHTQTRELLAVVRENTGGFESDRLEAVRVSEDRYSLVMRFSQGEVWTVRAAEEVCPSGYTSLPGGECTVECPWLNSQGVTIRYVDRSSGECRPCSMPTCGVGFEPIACTAETDAFCRPCEAVVGMVYVVAGSCEKVTMRPTAPCEIGSYAGPGGGYCEPCPLYTSTRYAQAVRLEQCKCVDGLVRRDGACVGEELYQYDAEVCARVGACQVPENAMLLPAGFGGEACRWACNAGYYRDRMAGFANQCRPCLSGGIRTSGDDDSPWSCE